MKRQVLFIQGGGKGASAEDEALAMLRAESLQLQDDGSGLAGND